MQIRNCDVQVLTQGGIVKYNGFFCVCVSVCDVESVNIKIRTRKR